MTGLRLLGLTAIAALFAACSPSEDAASPEAGPSDAAIIAQGERLYAEFCASCHGANLEGEPNWRQRNGDGRLPAPPHDATGHTWHHSDETLFNITKYGTAAFAPEGYETDMIGFEGVMSDAEIRAVLAYIKSEWPEDIQAIQSGIE